MSVCDDCERADYWECRFCCAKCYEDYGECPKLKKVYEENRPKGEKDE